MAQEEMGASPPASEGPCQLLPSPETEPRSWAARQHRQRSTPRGCRHALTTYKRHRVAIFLALISPPSRSRPAEMWVSRLAHVSVALGKVLTMTPAERFQSANQGGGSASAKNASSLTSPVGRYPTRRFFAVRQTAGPKMLNISSAGLLAPHGSVASDIRGSIPLRLIMPSIRGG